MAGNRDDLRQHIYSVVSPGELIGLVGVHFVYDALDGVGGQSRSRILNDMHMSAGKRMDIEAA